MKITTVCGHSFAPSLIRDGEVVLDCGAHRGDFSRWCSKNLNCTVFSFEPDPRLSATPPTMPNVEFVDRAVSAAEGVLALALGVKSCSSAVYKSPSQQTVDVPAITLDGFCTDRQLAGAVGMIKMDIEGSELDVLEHVSLALLKRTRQITVEFHDFLTPGDLPRINTVAQRLQDCGFYLIRFTHFTWGDCLFINERLAAVGVRTRLKLLVYDKYWIGIVRHLKRRLGRAQRQLRLRLST